MTSEDFKSYADEFSIFDDPRSFFKIKPIFTPIFTQQKSNSIQYNTLDRIIISDPLVICYDLYGKKRIVKADHGDIFNPATGVFYVILKSIVPSYRYTDICDYIDKNFDNDGRDKFLLGMLIPIFGVEETLDIWEKANDYDGSHTYTIKIYDILNNRRKSSKSHDQHSI